MLVSPIIVLIIPVGPFWVIFVDRTTTEALFFVFSLLFAGFCRIRVVRFFSEVVYSLRHPKDVKR